MTYKIIRVNEDETEEVLTELPEELVKSTKLYKDVLEESISRRQQLAKLKQEREAKVESEGEVPPVEAPKGELSPIDINTLRREIVAAVIGELQQHNMQSQRREAAVKEVMDKYNIPKDLSDVIGSLYDADKGSLEEKAQKLAKVSLPNAGVGGNTPLSTPDVVISNIMDKLLKG